MTPFIGWIAAAVASFVPHLPAEPVAHPVDTAIIAAFPEPDLHRQAVAVVDCESRGNPNAIGDHGASIGLFQIQPRWWANLIAGRDLTDPHVNARVARAIYDLTGDWRRWSCQPDRPRR